VLQSKDEASARDAVSRIVSRDSEAMSLEDTRRAALESLAENASDAVIAPLFWFLLLGPLGAMSYRMINTLDAMWGYRNARYENYGWLAAKADDVVNWLPARITARLFLWVGQNAPWQVVKLQAMTHASPNAGWPEVALAYAAHVRLGGPVMRDGVCDERPWYGAESGREPDHVTASDALIVVRNALVLGVMVLFVIEWIL